MNILVKQSRRVTRYVLRGTCFEKGFTLIELLVVITLLGILALMISGNFFSSLKKGRDTRRKADIQHIQKAMEIFYEDMGRFPPSGALSETQLCYHDGSAYSCSRKVYMQSIPKDPTIGTYVYETDTDGNYYKLYSCIENDQDVSSGVKLLSGAQDPNGWTTGCGPVGGVCANCKFKVESANAE